MMLRPWTVALIVVACLVIGPTSAGAGEQGPPTGTPAEIDFRRDLLRAGTAPQAGLRPDTISKLVTAIVVLQQVEARRVGLDLGSPEVWVSRCRQHVYSDLGLIALGALVERVTGKGLADAVHNGVTAPLGMRTAPTGRHRAAGCSSMRATRDPSPTDGPRTPRRQEQTRWHRRSAGAGCCTGWRWPASSPPRAPSPAARWAATATTRARRAR